MEVSLFHLSLFSVKIEIDTPEVLMDKKTLIIIIVAVFVISEIIRTFCKNTITNKLTRLLIKGEFEQFDQMLEKWYTRYFVAPFNLEYIRMNSYLARGDEQKIDEIFDRFEHSRLNKAQKTAVYGNAFYYYLSQEDTQKAKKYYQILKDNDDAKLDMTMMDRLYDIYIENGYQYLEETLEQYQTAKENEKPQLEGMLAKMYENKGDKKNAKVYEEKLQKYAEELQKKLQEQKGK